MRYGFEDTSLEWGGPSMRSGIRMTADGALETVPYQPLTADSKPAAAVAARQLEVETDGVLSLDERVALGDLASRELVDASL